MSNQYEFDPYCDERSAQANVFQIESSKLIPSLVVLALVSVGAFAGAVVAWTRASNAEQEARMLEYYVLEMDAKLIAAGYKTDAESVAKKLKENAK